jgi:hypothetical protein
MSGYPGRRSIAGVAPHFRSVASLTGCSSLGAGYRRGRGRAARPSGRPRRVRRTGPCCDVSGGGRGGVRRSRSRTQGRGRKNAVHGRAVFEATPGSHGDRAHRDVHEPCDSPVGPPRDRSARRPDGMPCEHTGSAPAVGRRPGAGLPSVSTSRRSQQADASETVEDDGARPMGAQNVSSRNRTTAAMALAGATPRPARPVSMMPSSTPSPAGVVAAAPAASAARNSPAAASNGAGAPRARRQAYRVSARVAVMPHDPITRSRSRRGLPTTIAPDCFNS